LDPSPEDRSESESQPKMPTAGAGLQRGIALDGPVSFLVVVGCSQVLFSWRGGLENAPRRMGRARMSWGHREAKPGRGEGCDPGRASPKSPAMEPDRFARLKELLLKARDLSEEERSAFLDDACKDDLDLRQEAEAILAWGHETHDILKPDAVLARALEGSLPPARLIGQTVSHYEITTLIGEGGMGQVYRARDTRLDRDVALKVISPSLASDPDRIRRFEQEARAAGALAHPNIVAVYEIGVHQDSPFVVMELLEGESLRQRLNQGSLPIRKATDYASQAARGLAAAHEKGIIHRDIKPENLFVTKDGRVKILDFGVAKLVRSDKLVSPSDKASADSLTGSGAIIGTSGYMSPEQARGQAADHRSDLFALGATLHEMLTGHRTFQKDSFVETLHAILNEDPPPFSASGREIPAGIETIVRHCLEKSPEERFQSARDLAFALEGLSGTGGGAPVAGAGATATAKAKRRRAYITAGIAAVAIAALGFAIGTIGQARLSGRASPLTWRPLAQERGRVLNARFSPDLASVFYAAQWEGRPVEVFETRRGFPAPHALGLSSTNLLSISRSGRMAVSLGDAFGINRTVCSTLAEVPISGGVPRPILDNVLSAGWSPDGKTLALAHQPGGPLSKTRLEMPPGHVLYETDACIRSVCVAPSGKWLAFVEGPFPHSTGGSILIMDMEGRIRARTPAWTTAGGLAWSPDGREAWFTVCDSVETELRAMRPDGRQRVIQGFPGGIYLHDIARDGSVLLGPLGWTFGIRGRQSPQDEERELRWLDVSFAKDISRDHRMLLFEEQGIGGGPLASVCVRGMDGSPPVKLGDGGAGTFSPDGKWVLAIYNGSPQHLMILPIGAGDSLSLPPGGIEGFGIYPKWFPDGESIVFDGKEAGRPWRVYRQDLKGGLPHPITPEGYLWPRVSPDGRFIAVASEDLKLCVLSVAGGEPRVIGDLAPDERVCQWTADSKFLYVAKWGTRLSVMLVNKDTGERKPWKVLDMPDRAGLQQFPPAITPDGLSYAYTYFRESSELWLVRGLK
jgi:WD40 repeat protein